MKQRKMTKRAKVVFALITLVILFNIIEMATTYKREGVVVDTSLNTVTVEDKLGNLWEVEASGFGCGDEVVMTMSDKMTSRIADDFVKDIKLK